MTTYTYRCIMEINCVSNCPIHNFLDLAINQNVKGLFHVIPSIKLLNLNVQVIT
jgi:hypothetical protein